MEIEKGVVDEALQKVSSTTKFQSLLPGLPCSDSLLDAINMTTCQQATSLQDPSYEQMKSIPPRMNIPPALNNPIHQLPRQLKHIIPKSRMLPPLPPIRLLRHLVQHAWLVIQHQHLRELRSPEGFPPGFFLRLRKVAEGWRDAVEDTLQSSH